MVRVFMHLAHGDLMGAPVSLGSLAIDFLRAGPPFGRAEHDHRPERALAEAIPARVGLDPFDLTNHGIQRGRHEVVHLPRIIPFDEVRRIAITAKKVIELFVADPGQDGGIGDLVAVQVQDGQNRPVGGRVQEFVGMPAGRQWSGFRLAIADDTGDDEIGIIERGTVRVR